MNRKEFLQQGIALGLGLPFLNLFLTSCEDDEGVSIPNITPTFDGKVLIVGAGAAGLAAGYMLQRFNIDFEIVEAFAQYGGRLKRNSSLADFPIDLGAEWMHVSPSVLSDIVADPTSDVNIDFIVYNPQEIKRWNDGNLADVNVGSNFYSEYKFKNSTWFGFFEQLIVPSIQSNLTLNTPISSIDYSNNGIVATALNGTTFEADRVLITASANVLQDDVISFNPSLPASSRNAIDNIVMGDGIKVFIEFSEKFYPDILLFGNLFDALAQESQIYYDAAFRKDSTRNILGLFAVQDGATPFTSLSSDQAIIDFILEELDEIFDGRASQTYMQHVIQNWSAERYIRGSYSDDFDDDQDNIINELTSGIDRKVYFAGEALSADNQATVHGACESAFAVVERILTT